MVKKVILMDLDNTLYEYEPVHEKALRETYKVLDKVRKIAFKKFKRLFDLSREEIQRELLGTASSHNRALYFQRLIEKTHKTVEPDIILKMYNAYWDTFLKNIKLEKDVISTLKKLKKNNIKIIILSDLTTNIQLRKIRMLRLTPYVDFLVTSEEAGREKPHPSMFLLALNKVNALPQDAIVLGDSSKKDIEGANAVDIETVLLKRDRKKLEFRGDHEKPNHIINKIPEILNIMGFS